MIGRGTAPHPPMSTRDQALEIRNRTPAFGWGLMAVWLAMLALCTSILLRDGPHPSQPAWIQHGALALFWLIGLPAAGYAFSRPCTVLRVGADGREHLVREGRAQAEQQALAARLRAARGLG